MKPKTWTLPKFKLLARKCGGADVACGVLTWLWHLAGTFDETGGRLPDNDWESLLADTSVFDRANEIGALLTAGRWIDEANGHLRVHDWEDHRPHYINERLRKRAGSSGNPPGSSGNPPGTFQEVPTPSDSDYQSDQLIQLTRKTVTEGEVAQTARALFRAMQYRGNDGRWLWKAAALVHVGLLAESDVCGLAAACRTKKNKPAYFHASLKRNLSEAGLDLQDLSQRVTITPDWPAIYPGD